VDPLVSVIVPTKNRPDTLREAMASIAAQTYPAVEVVVVNDGGTPVAAVLDPFAAQVKCRLVESPSPQGAADARNLGLAHASGDLIAFLDDDDVFLPEHLELAVRTLGASGADLVYATTLQYDHRRPPAGIDRAAAVATFGFPNAFDLLPMTNPLPILGIVCRAGLGLRFDTSLPIGEDWELWLRLVHGQGCRAVLQAEPTAVYFRVPQRASAMNAADTDGPAFRRMYETYLRICARHPVEPGGRADKLRVFMELVYVLGERRIAAGGQIPPLCFTDVMAAFSRYLLGPPDDRELRRRIYLALGETPPEG
jgi:glycosyltransferase involved in cell wall biosynthesis